MRIAILGAGGVGGYYGALLARAGNEVAVLARGDHLAAIRADGLRIREPEGEFTVRPAASEDVNEFGDADLAVVAVKSYSLAAIAPAARTLAEGGADVLPLLNGVDAVDRLERLGVPGDRLVAGLTYISAARTAPGIIERFSPFRRVTVGEPGGGRSRRAAAIATVFGEAGAEAHATGDVVTELWRKFVFLVALSAGCGLSRTAIGPLRSTPLGKLLLERAVREAILVARERGARVADDEDGRVLALIEGLPAEMKPSFLLDVEAGGPTELDILSGAVVRYGRAAHLATPVHDTAAGAIGAATA